MKKDQEAKMENKLEYQNEEHNPHTCFDCLLEEKTARIRLAQEIDNLIELELDKNVLNLDDIVSVISDVKYNLILQKCNYISVSLDNEILKRDEKIEILKQKQEILNETKILSGKA